MINRIKFDLAVIALTLMLAACDAQQGMTLDTASPDAASTYAARVDAMKSQVGGGGGGGAAAGVAAPVLADQTDAAQPGAATQHVMVYSAGIRLVVADGAQALDSIHRMADSFGGYLQAMDSRSITVRVPAAKFDDAVAAIKRIGEVVDIQIKADEVTEQMRDLDIRLANAEQTRQRLLKLIDSSTKVEDTVKIEDELEKVTETIELLKGKIRFLQSQVAYSVVRVDINSGGRSTLSAITPFPWIRELARGAVAGASPASPDGGGLFGGGVRFDLPSGFIRYYQLDDLTEAMSADGMFIKAQRHTNYKGGDIGFWSTLARRSVVEDQSVAISQEADARASGDPAKLLEGTKDIPGGAQGYLLLLSVDNDHVYTFEAWGPKELIAQNREALEKAAKTLE